MNRSSVEPVFEMLIVQYNTVEPVKNVNRSSVKPIWNVNRRSVEPCLEFEL